MISQPNINAVDSNPIVYSDPDKDAESLLVSQKKEMISADKNVNKELITK